jgi:hypothetical protein
VRLLPRAGTSLATKKLHIVNVFVI